MASWRKRLGFPDDYDEAFKEKDMPVWVLLVLIPLGNGLYTSQTLEVYGSKRDCLIQAHKLDGYDKLICVEVE